MVMPSYFTRLLTELNQHWLLERLFFASLEFAALALIVWATIHLLRLRQPRLIALLWLLVLAKPIASLALGGFLPTLALRPPPPVIKPIVISQSMPTMNFSMPSELPPPPKFELPNLSELLIW